MKLPCNGAPCLPSEYKALVAKNVAPPSFRFAQLGVKDDPATT